MDQPIIAMSVFASLVRTAVWRIGTEITRGRFQGSESDISRVTQEVIESARRNGVPLLPISAREIVAGVAYGFADMKRTVLEEHPEVRS